MSNPTSISTPIVTTEVKYLDISEINMAVDQLTVYPRIDLEPPLPLGFFCCFIVCGGIGKCCGKTSYDCVRIACCRCCISPPRPTWNRKFDMSVCILRNVMSMAYPHKKAVPFFRLAADGEIHPSLPVFSGVTVKKGDKTDGFLASQGHEWLYPKNEGFPDFSLESTKKRKFILFIHGGAFLVGSPGTHRLLVADLVRSTGATVLSIQYRRAPEFQYPAAELDGLEAFKYLSSKVDSSRIVLSGDSAGGALCIAVMARIRDLGLPRARGAILLSPYVDYYKNDTESCRVNSLTDYIITKYIPVAGQMYVDPPNVAVTPAYLDLRGFPPLIVEVGDAEILRDVILGFIRKAIQSGVDVEHNVYPDMVHVFQLFRISNQEQALQSLKNIGKFMNRIFDNPVDVEAQGIAASSNGGVEVNDSGVKLSEIYEEFETRGIN